MIKEETIWSRQEKKRFLQVLKDFDDTHLEILSRASDINQNMVELVNEEIETRKLIVKKKPDKVIFTCHSCHAAYSNGDFFESKKVDVNVINNMLLVTVYCNECHGKLFEFTVDPKKLLTT